MPALSLFTPLGHLQLTQAPSHGERFFETGKTSLGTSHNTAQGTRSFAWLYAWSMLLATVRYTLERAGEQWDPRATYEFLPIQERERGVIPHPGHSVQERRDVLTRRRRLPRPPSRTEIENTLREELGDRFVAYVPCPKDAIVNWPVALGHSPQVLTRPGLPRRIAKTAEPITALGAPVTVAYEQFADGVAWQLQPKDVVVLEAENDDRAERVTILEAEPAADTPATITFVPTKAHDTGVTIVKQGWPLWTGSKRHSLVVLAASAAEDPEARRIAHETMRRLARGTSTWDLAGDNDDAATAGPFKVGEGKFGVTPIGYVQL